MLRKMDEEADDVLLVAAAVCAVKLRKRIRRRRFWVHPINCARNEKGDFRNVILELRNDAILFKRYFRMSFEQFDRLLSVVGPNIQLQNTRFRNCIDPGQQLAVCLRLCPVFTLFNV